MISQSQTRHVCWFPYTFELNQSDWLVCWSWLLSVCKSQLVVRFSHLLGASWHHIGSLKLAIMGLFTSWNLVNSTIKALHTLQESGVNFYQNTTGCHKSLTWQCWKHDFLSCKCELNTQGGCRASLLLYWWKWFGNYKTAYKDKIWYHYYKMQNQKYSRRKNTAMPEMFYIKLWNKNTQI